ncbi:MAG: MarR family transcriptional regulator [Myxococcales bacterium]|nr:MarR family transcriptional regulator [Myxococcales bacterium]
MYDRDKLEAAKRASVGQLLFKCARLFNELAIGRVRAVWKVPIRTAHTSVFPHIDLEGTRLTELARRVGVSKQAVGQLVDELVEMGALERVPDPSDGRAKLIRFSSRRGRRITDGLAVLMQIETELARELGRSDTPAPADKMAQLHDLLLELLPLLETKLEAK